MKTKFKYLMFALVAVLACVSISSCSKEDDLSKGIGNYYFRLTNVESNCVDPNEVYNYWVRDNNADSKGKLAIGRIDRQTAEEWFETTVTSLANAYSAAYEDKLPEGGLIRLTFYLGSDLESYGASGKYAYIEVRNTGTKIL